MKHCLVSHFYPSSCRIASPSQAPETSPPTPLLLFTGPPPRRRLLFTGPSGVLLSLACYSLRVLHKTDAATAALRDSMASIRSRLQETVRCQGKIGEAKAKLREAEEELFKVLAAPLSVEMNDSVDDALKVLDEMLDPEAKFLVDCFTGHIVIGSLLRDKQIGRSVREEEVVGLVSKFGKHGVFLNSVVLTKLVTGLCRNGKVSLA